MFLNNFIYLHYTINSILDVINFSEVNIKSKKLIIKSKHGPNRYNIPILELYIDYNNAEIKELIVDLDSKDNIIIKGDIKNFGSLSTIRYNSISNPAAGLPRAVSKTCVVKYPAIHISSYYNLFLV